MPRFTITRNGQSLGQIDAFGDRIDLGSGSECEVVIDDAVVAANQARFVRHSITQNYRIEPVSVEPAMTVNGIILSAPIEVADGAVLNVAGNAIRVNYLAGELSPLALPPAASAEELIEGTCAEPASFRPAAPPREDVHPAEAQLPPAFRVRLLVPLVDPSRGGKIPAWGWILAGAGIVLLAGILLLIAL